MNGADWLWNSRSGCSVHGSLVSRLVPSSFVGFHSTLLAAILTSAEITLVAFSSLLLVELFRIVAPGAEKVIIIVQDRYSKMGKNKNQRQPNRPGKRVRKQIESERKLEVLTKLVASKVSQPLNESKKLEIEYLNERNIKMKNRVEVAKKKLERLDDKNFKIFRNNEFECRSRVHQCDCGIRPPKKIRS
ncbi:hypothetical protein QAD02_000473 [Eretmocerus hayati]|uniref:Uncharacterized protein n=1 Tax=Eretmocerus hayati TaxID=131215 RepID=A0ACC2NFU3_9HYME|nr:hypothetical protein QAD02_000473 [Eretmocerus hayati]